MANANQATKSPKARSGGEFCSPAETQRLLASSAAYRVDRLNAGDMLTTDEAAELAQTSRVTINAWISKGRAIGLSQIKRGFRMPRWQFDAPLWDALPQLTKALGTKEGWAILSFLETPLGGLGGLTPRVAVEQGDLARVLDLAKYES